jgi:hypothetical protein
MNNEQKRFAICIDNTDNEASLILKKIYEILPDREAAEDDLLRIIDESGEDYLFHESHFLVLDFSNVRLGFCMKFLKKLAS